MTEVKMESFMYIISGKSKSILPEDINNYLENFCYNCDLDLEFDGISILALVIYYDYPTCFNILLDRNIDINKKIREYDNEETMAILWAIDSKNIYFLEKLIDKEELDFYIILENKKSIYNYLAALCNDLNSFNKVIDLMYEKNKNKATNLLKLYNIDVIFYDLIYNYSKNNNINLFFSKIEKFLSIIGKNNILCFKNVYFFEKIISEFKVPELITPLYRFLKKYFKPKLEYPIIFGAFFNDLEFIKIMHEEENYSLNDNAFEDLTALNISLRENNFEIADYLIKNGADIFKYGSEYDNLLNSIIHDNIEVFKYLGKKMDIFKEYIIKDNLVLLPKYFRPIHYAFYHNSYNIILYLVSMGENIIYKGNCEISPLDTRQKYYKISISQLNILSADYKSLKEYISLNKAKRNDECCICLDDIYNKKIVKLKCGHIFHKSCLIKSMKNTKLCPYCRSEIEIEHYVYNNLGDVVLKNEIKKVKRRKSETDFISNNLKNKTINKKKYYESEDIEFIKLENTCFRNIMNTKFEILKNKLEKNQKERDLKLIRQILIKSKHISKKQKVVGKYKTPPPTPIPEIRKFKNELEKLKEIHISIEIDINYVRKSRNNKINRLTY